jgi:hypothetical protein
MLEVNCREVTAAGRNSQRRDTGSSFRPMMQAPKATHSIVTLDDGTHLDRGTSP